MAKYLGVSIDVLDGDSAFVLVKLVKNSGTIDVSGNLHLRDSPARAANGVRVGDPDSVLNFVQKFGSHFLQVRLAYDPPAAPW